MGQTSRPADQPGEAKRSNQQNIHRFKRGQTCAIGRRGVGASYHPLRTEEKRVRRTARLTRAPIGRAPARSSRRGGAEGEEAAPGGGLGVGGGDRVPLAGSIVSPAGNVRGGWKGRSREMGLGTSYRRPFCCQLIWRVAWLRLTSPVPLPTRRPVAPCPRGPASTRPRPLPPPTWGATFASPARQSGTDEVSLS